MKMRTFFVSVCVLGMPFAVAQDDGGGFGSEGKAGGGGNAGEASGNKDSDASKVRPGFWTANLPGGTYSVSLSRITSVSLQTYFMEGGLQVQEVNIDTMGSALARFYYISPPKSGSSALESGLSRAQELVQKANERTGTPDVQAIVTKQYPITTHAKTIEYRLRTEAEIKELFANAMRAWQSGRAGNLTIK